MSLFTFYSFFSCFSLLGVSLWPFFTSFSVLLFTFSFVYFLKLSYFFYFLLSFFFFFFTLWFWLDAFDSESSAGLFTFVNYFLFRFGFLLFICSEVLFFFGFFWCYFSNCWSPSYFLNLWPPYSFDSIIVDVYGYPLLNTVLLLSSGLSLTLVHYGILSNPFPILRVEEVEVRWWWWYVWYFDYIDYGYYLTFFLGFLFLFFQFYEYVLSSISLNSTVYGSVFFVLTGFHGFHVFVGLVMLLVSFLRYCSSSYSTVDHTGFECAAWYWHFVDVVWLFLYVFVYWYGS